MDSDSQNFEQLRRLLALKRHEQPPPGYFENFSSKVVARIEAGEQGAPDTFGERFLNQFSFLQRFWAALEARPALAGAFGVAVCGLLVAGVMRSEDAGPGTVVTPGANATLSSGMGTQLAAFTPQSQLGSSTNPAPPFNPGDLFNRANSLLGPQIEPASAPFVPDSERN